MNGTENATDVAWKFAQSGAAEKTISNTVDHIRLNIRNWCLPYSLMKKIKQKNVFIRHELCEVGTNYRRSNKKRIKKT